MTQTNEDTLKNWLQAQQAFKQTVVQGEIQLEINKVILDYVNGKVHYHGELQKDIDNEKLGKAIDDKKQMRAKKN